MVFFPNCKINLGLHIIRKRADGYHDLESVFYPILLKDVIEVVNADAFEFIPSGLPVPGDHENNSCVKAYHLLKRKFPHLPATKMYLYKNIPSGAGLGGGSADGAFMLALLNKKFEMGLTEDQLRNLSLQIGSDCPFFISNRPSFVSGRGEVLEDFQLDLSNYSIVIVHPGIHINTAWAFSKIRPTIPAKSIRQIVASPIENWKDKLINDFEDPVLQEYPFLQQIKLTLYNAGALYAAMSGSGSSFYGIFKKNNIPSISFDANFRVDIIN